MNLAILAPELTVFLTAVTVILLDLFIQRKAVLAFISILGLLFSIYFSVTLWGTVGVAFNGMFTVDQFAIFFKILFSSAAILVILASTDFVSRFKRSRGEFYGLILLATLGMMFMAATSEMISIYISLEVASISLYVLASFLRDNKSSEAGLKYLLLGAIASSVLLYGMALVYGFTGSTHLSEISASLKGLSGQGLTDNPGLLLGIVFITAGFGFKIATVPFQMWVPDVYEGAPTPVTAFLSVASKAAGFAVLIRVFYHAFGATWMSADWGMMFAVLSAVSMTVGNIIAIQQTNIKRMLGYSSIAQAGYIMVGLAAMGLAPVSDVVARSGVIFFLSSYTLTNLGAFIAIIAISNGTGSERIEDFSGMIKRAPLLSLGLILCLISLTGIPPAAGFIAKVYIFSAGVTHGLTWLVIIAVINSVIAAYYYLRVVLVMVQGDPISRDSIPSSPALRIALSITCLGVLFIGILPAFVQVLSVISANIFSR